MDVRLRSQFYINYKRRTISDHPKIWNSYIFAIHITVQGNGAITTFMRA